MQLMKKNVYLGRKQQCKPIVELLNIVTSREMYAKVEYFISKLFNTDAESITICRRIRNFVNETFERMKRIINNTVCAGDLV